jgi:hypothetical protein
VIVLVLVPRRLILASTIGIEALDQLRQHTDCSKQQPLSFINPLNRGELPGNQRVQTRRTLYGRPARIIEKFCTLLSLAFAIPFSGVEQRGKTRPIKLIVNLAIQTLSSRANLG